MSYQGPHVAVTQTFESAPGAVAVEGLPTAIVGSSFEVFSNSVIGELKTASAVTLGYGTTKGVIFNETVAGKQAYDFYKPKVEVSVGGKTFEIEATATALGFDVKEKPTYEITSADTASMPMCKTTASAGSAIGLKTVAVATDLRNYGIIAGQTVTIGSAVHVIASISSDGMVITLESAIATTAVTSGDTVVIGVASVALNTIANTITFQSPLSGVRVGDIVAFKSKVTGADASYKASIIRIFDNGKSVEIFTSTKPTVDTGYLDIKNIESFEAVSGGFTSGVTAVSIKRFVAFAKSFTSTGVTATPSTSPTSKFTVANTAFSASFAGLGIGDVIKAGAGGATYYNVTGVVVGGTNTEIFVDGAAAGTTIFAFRPVTKATVRATFRAINIAPVEAVQRITGEDDIVKYFGRISPYNELAFMIAQARRGNGGKVVYARNVSPKLADISSGYSAALEDLKMFDVYSHAFGTTDFSIVGGISSYCNQQSEKYRAHERIARVTYDADSAYTMLRKIVATATGTKSVTIAGALAAGCGIGDVFVGYTDGVETIRTTLTATPSATAINAADNVAGTVNSGAILAGSKYKQAMQIAALASVDSRRMKIVCPGHFAGTIDGTDIANIPPYFLTAYYAGLDDGLVVSQSHTNFGQAPGITNISLKTDTYFSVDDLDIIGEAGIDILIQDGLQVSNAIMSRHDLSTDMFDILTREWSVTKQVDITSKTLRKTAKKYVGKYNITKPLLDTVTRDLRIAAKALVDSGVTFAITIVSVERSKEVADKVVIGVKQTVFIAGNYYDININVGA